MDKTTKAGTMGVGLPTDSGLVTRIGEAMDGSIGLQGMYADASLEADRIVIALRDRVAELEAERDSYREVAHAALDQLHTIARERDRMREQVRQLRVARQPHRQEAA